MVSTAISHAAKFGKRPPKTVTSEIYNDIFSVKTFFFNVLNHVSNRVHPMILLNKRFLFCNFNAHVKARI